MRTASTRTTRAVFHDHLRKRAEGALELDLATNYADDVVLLTGFGVFRGKHGVRRCAALLSRHVPCAEYTYRTRHISGEVAFLEWTARCPTAEVEDGADSFLIRDGLIVIQTIHYTARPVRRAGTRRADGNRNGREKRDA